jgi:hypothetical protein
MTEIRRLDPHAALPGDLGRHVLVMCRFDSDAPNGTHVEISLVTGPGQVDTVQPRGEDGRPMAFEDAVQAGRRVAESEGLSVVYAVDRTQGALEQQVLARHGDHSVGSAPLVDMDLEDGEIGPTMRPGG